MRKRTLEEFIDEAQKVHGNKYDYSRVIYESSLKKVCIICPDHGEFWQIAGAHLKGAQCPKCYRLSRRSNTEAFIAKCKEIYGDLYDYTKVKYIHSKEKVCVICPKHGEFWVTPNNHTRGSRCPACFGTPKKTIELFVEEARKIHGNKFDYSKVEYNGEDVKVCIICPEHGEFWQTPNNHLFGAGCPTCPESNMEGEIRHLLLSNNIAFEQEKGFDWLVYHRRLFLDFFLPEYGVAIECQGGQHFYPTQLFGGEDFYKLTIERDAAKKRLCEEHGIRLLYYSNAHIQYPYPVFESMRLLLKAIKDKGVVADNTKWHDLQLTFEFEDE